MAETSSNNVKEFVNNMLNYTENKDTSLHQSLYNEIYEYFVLKNNQPTKLDLEMLQYLSPNKVIDNNTLRDVIRYMLLYTYKANANEIKNHKKINDNLEKIQEQLTNLLKLHEKPEASAAS